MMRPILREAPSPRHRNPAVSPSGRLCLPDPQGSAGALRDQSTTPPTRSTGWSMPER